MGKLGEYVECQTCGVAFEPAVLTQKHAAPARPAQADLAKLINSIPAQLQGGKPVEYVTRDLTAAGVDRDAALAMIKAHLPEGRRTCERCGLSYAPAVKVCAGCQQPI
jgi:hypothetical protein